MILNSTVEYDQILKQMTYGGRKVKEKKEILRMEEEGMEEREKRKYVRSAGRYNFYIDNKLYKKIFFNFYFTGLLSYITIQAI